MLTPHDRAQDDRGAVAVLVALLAAGVLFTIGALVVDLGSVWMERFGLKGVAESAALAGAAELPEAPQPGLLDPTVKADVVKAAVGALCAPGNQRDAWLSPSVCPTGTVPGWAVNGDEGDGEVSIQRSDSKAYPTLDSGLRPWVVRVRTPPVKVSFALAAVIGDDGADVTASAGARRGLPYPAETPVAAAPFYLTVEDLQHAQDDPNGLGLVCLRTTPRPEETVWDPADYPDPTDAGPPADPLPDPDLEITGITPGGAGEAPTDLRVTLGPLPAALPGLTKDTVTVYVGSTAFPAETRDVLFDSLTGIWTVLVRTPDFRPEPVYGSAPVWVHVDDGTPQGIDSDASLTSLAYPSGTSVTDCDEVADGRGLVDLARADGTRGNGAPTVADVRDGLSTRLHSYTSWPDATEAPGAGTPCWDPAIDNAEPAAAPAGYVADANCVPVRPGSVDPAAPPPAAARVRPADLTDGWLGTSSADGRLSRGYGSCSFQRSTSYKSRNLDATSLFRSSNGLVDSSVSPFGLRDRLSAALPPDDTYRGTILPKIFKCPRLLLVPVLDTDRPPDAGGYPVVGLTYFWVSDNGDVFRSRALRGLITDDSGEVVGIRGWVVDPGYVRGGEWYRPTGYDPTTALPMGVPKRAVLVRTPCDDHPDSTVGCTP